VRPIGLLLASLTAMLAAGALAPAGAAVHDASGPQAGQPAAEPQSPRASPGVQASLDDADRLLSQRKPEEALAAAQRALAAAGTADDAAGRAAARRQEARSLEALARRDDALTAWAQSADLWRRIGAVPGEIEALSAQALALGRDQPVRAAPLVEQAVGLATEEKVRPLAAIAALNAAADRARTASLLDVAQRLASAALAIAEKKAPDSPAVAWSLAILGGIATNRGDLDAARDDHQRALAIRERIAPDSLDVAHSLNSLGNIAYIKGDLDAARAAQERALAIQERLAPDSVDVAMSLNNLGGVAYSRGDLDAARDNFARSLAIKEKIDPGSLDSASTLGNLGAVAYRRGDLDAARDAYQRALAIEERFAPGSPENATCLMSLGNIANSRGDLDAAGDAYRRALAMAEKRAPGSLEVAAILNNLGVIASTRGDLDGAREFYGRALAIQEQHAPGSLDVAMSLINLGVVAVDRGDLDAGGDYYQRALAIQEKQAPDSPDVAASLNNLGVVARHRGDLDGARDDYQRALTLNEKVAPGSLDVAGGLNNLGDVAFARGDLEAARDYHERALEVQEKLAPGGLDVAESLVDLGQVAFSRGDLAAARDHYERALAIQERLAPGSLAIAASLCGLAEALRKQGRPDESEEHLARAWSIVREQRSALVGDEEERAFGVLEADVAPKLVGARLAQGKIAEAFQALEEGRAHGLLELLSERGLSQAGNDPELWRTYVIAEHAFHSAAQDLAAAGESEARLERETQAATLPRGGATADAAAPNRASALAEAAKERAAASSAYTKARLEQDRILGEIRRSVPGLEPRARSFDEARQLLPKRSVFLAWLVGQEEATVFVIPSDAKLAIEAHAIPLGEAQLAKRVAALVDRIGEEASLQGASGPAGAHRPGPIDPALVSESRDLFETLLPRPARAAVQRSERVIVSPDGPLWDLPFAALVTNGSGDPKWLGLEKRLSTTASMTVLALERERASATGTTKREVLVVGDPLLTRTAMQIPPPPVVRGAQSSLVAGGSLPGRIPASAEEARRIAALYGTEPLIGEAATEVAVRQRISRAAVVHLATHAYFHPRLAMSSGILLAPPKSEPGPGETDNDGALQAWEFGRTLPLDADLVVLSACETGRGERVRGEGLVGLTRALQGAGARSVVASHWKVADASTAALMVSFHERLKEGLAKDEALRRAMMESAAGPATHHPYYWAAFFLTGDPDSPLR
jgi:CHAT domain-containing protein/tetratricopeptide (TPR) repeat protein